MFCPQHLYSRLYSSSRESDIILFFTGSGDAHCTETYMQTFIKNKLRFYYCVYRCAWCGWMQEFFLLCRFQGMNSDCQSWQCLPTKSSLTSLFFSFLLASFAMNPWMTRNLLALGSWFSNTLKIKNLKFWSNYMHNRTGKSSLHDTVVHAFNLAPGDGGGLSLSLRLPWIT